MPYLNTEHRVDTTIWLKPWLKIISFGSNFFHLAKVFATTNSEPEVALGCWIFSITILVSNNLDPDQDQAQQFVGPDLGRKCLQRLSADNKIHL